VERLHLVRAGVAAAAKAATLPGGATAVPLATAAAVSASEAAAATCSSQ